MTDAEREALRLICFWWACIEAGRECDGDPPLDDGDNALHYVANGATAIVTVGHLRSLVGLAVRMLGVDGKAENLTRLEVLTRHPGDYVLHNEADGTRWRGDADGKWKRA